MQRTITWERSVRFGSLSSPSLNNVFQDFTDKNKQSNACFYLAILSGAPSFYILAFARIFLLQNRENMISNELQN
jgi:hypothetical protein